MSDWDIDENEAADNADEAGYGEAINATAPGIPGELILNNVRVPAWGITRRDLSVFGGKLTVGPFDKDSDELLSSWIVTNTSGGGFVRDHVEGATDQMFRESTCWTMSANQLSPNPKMHTLHIDVNAGGARTWGHGRYKEYGYISAGAHLARLGDGHGGTMPWPLPTATYVAGLALTPVSHGLWYRDKLYIPEGTKLQTYDGSVIATVQRSGVDLKASYLATLDNRLYILDSDGKLNYLNWAGTWSTDHEDRTIPEHQQVRGLARFFDRVGRMTLFILTDTTIWVYDPDTDTILSAQEEEWPRNNANTMTMWGDESLYIGIALGVRRHSRDGLVSPVGMDRVGPQGTNIPYAYPDNFKRNLINELARSYNFLIAAVGPDATNFSLNSIVDTGKIMAWNESGWHQIAKIPAAENGSFEPNVIAYDDPQLGYIALIGGFPNNDPGTNDLDQVHILRLPVNMHGPMQTVNGTIQVFERIGEHVTGFFDAGMQNFYKTASHIEVMVKPIEPHDSYTLEPMVRVDYRLSEYESFTTLGTVTGPGLHRLEFGVANDGFSEGMAFQKIEFRFRLETTTTEAGADPESVWTRPTIIEYFNFKFEKRPQPNASWTCAVDMEAELTVGEGPRTLSLWLIEQTYKAPYLRLKRDDTVYRVRVSQFFADEDVSDDGRRMGTLTLIEVPIQEFEVDVP